jgi:hypothetical protein
MTPQRRKLILFIGVSALLFLLGYITLRQIALSIAEAFESRVVLISETSPYQITHEGLDISILRQSFRLNKVLILPDTLSKDTGNLQPHITIGAISANDFELLPLLFAGKLNIGQIQMERIDIVYKAHKKEALYNKPRKVSQKTAKRPLKNLNVEHVELKEYSFVSLSRDSKDSLTNVIGETLSISQVAFERSSDNGKLSLNPSRLKLKGSNLKGAIQATELKLADFEFDIYQRVAYFKGLQIGNRDLSKEKTRRKAHNTPVNSIKIKGMECFGIQMDKLFQKLELNADSLIIDQATTHIVKNVDKPWNRNVTIPLPQQMLRDQKVMFWFKKIRIENSGLEYIEFSRSDEIVIPIKKLNASILNVGSRKNAVVSDSSNSMEVQLNATLFDDLDFNLDMNFMDPMKANDFEFKGSTGPFRFESFNPIMVPTSNIKFESGQVKRIYFNGTGNTEKTSGEFVMLYDDLKTTVLKHKSQKKNKTFSWLANTSVRKQNPKKGKLKVAMMGYERVPYKGFGNYMFKTIESGLINSVYPFGIRKRYD